jgi:hypothetical protein
MDIYRDYFTREQLLASLPLRSTSRGCWGNPACFGLSA